jgi:hypothetical protein
MNKERSKRKKKDDWKKGRNRYERKKGRIEGRYEGTNMKTKQRKEG